MTPDSAARSVLQPGWSRNLLVLMVGLITALVFRLSFGLASGNHNTYVLGGLRRLDPGLLAQAAQTWLSASSRSTA